MYVKEMKALAFLTVGIYAFLFVMLNMNRDNKSTSERSESNFDEQIVEERTIDPPSVSTTATTIHHADEIVDDISMDTPSSVDRAWIALEAQNRSVSQGSSGFDKIVEATPIDQPSSVGGMAMALEEPRAKRSM